jgi:hypothetical protein
MTTPYEGQPANVENNLPAAVNISSTTNATPIVITTSTAHGLKPGDYFQVTGATEAALNNVHLMAGSVTSTTVVALVAPAGTNTVGATGGGAVGTLLNLSYGSTVDILTDNDPPMAALWNVPYSVALDRLAWLMYRATVRSTAQVPATNSTITVAADVWRCSTPLAGLTHTVANAPAQGYQVTIWRGSAGAFNIVLQRADTSVIATLPTGTQSAVTLTYYGSSGWEVTGGYAFT